MPLLVPQVLYSLVWRVKTLRPPAAACLERRFLSTKLHRLADDGKQAEILTKLTTFKKSIYVPSM